MEPRAKIDVLARRNESVSGVFVISVLVVVLVLLVVVVVVVISLISLISLLSLFSLFHHRKGSEVVLKRNMSSKDTSKLGLATIWAIGVGSALGGDFFGWQVLYQN